MSKTFIAFWCNEGLEYLEDVSNFVGEVWKEEQVIATLSGESALEALLQTQHRMAQTLQGLRLRAQYNPQRNYELYSFNIVDQLDQEDIESMFTDNPQFIVDWIRQHGTAHIKKLPERDRVIT